jgi:hypothetical protein
MNAVLASRLDPEARALVASWSSAGAALLSAADLCSPGWVFDPADPAAGAAVVNGAPVRVSDLEGVLTRRPAVVAEELDCIDPDDRAYVSAEVNAFLVAWLSALPCRVVNRPTTTSLCGPAWSALHWQAAAARMGMAWAAAASDREPRTVVVCGSQVLFAAKERDKRAAASLARAAGVSLLAVRFQGDAICGASVSPALADDAVRAELLAYLRGRA